MINLTRRKSPRLKEYDYSQTDYYLVTIYTYDKRELFGDFNVGTGLVSAHNKIKLSTIGNIINHRWNDIPNRYTNI